MSDEMTGNCDRCGISCRVAGAGNEDARLLRFSQIPHGFCGDCATTQWLKTMPPICDILEREPQRVRMLLDERMRLQFATLMLHGNADLPSSQINWDRVVEMWEMPFPKGSLRRLA